MENTEKEKPNLQVVAMEAFGIDIINYSKLLPKNKLLYVLEKKEQELNEMFSSIGRIDFKTKDSFDMKELLLILDYHIKTKNDAFDTGRIKGRFFIDG